MSTWPTDPWEAGYRIDRDDPAVRIRDDYYWHRKMYEGARFKWVPGEVMGIVSSYTGGQHEFTTVDDLRRLQQVLYDVLAYVMRIRNTMSVRLTWAHSALRDDWERVAELLEMNVVEIREVLYYAEMANAEFSDAEIRAVFHKIPFTNMLSEAWELKQFWALYQAAANMVEDTICDLASELEPTRPTSVLAAATDTGTGLGLTQRIQQGRTERGDPGDSRRIPRQVLPTKIRIW